MGVHIRQMSPDIIKDKRKTRKAQEASIIAFQRMAEAQEIEDNDISQFSDPVHVDTHRRPYRRMARMDTASGSS